VGIVHAFQDGSELLHDVGVGNTARNDFSVAMNDNRRSAKDHRLDVVLVHPS
jgi:hypothetical protein